MVSQPVSYDEMKDFENLWLQHQAEFLPIFLTLEKMQPSLDLGLESRL